MPRVGVAVYEVDVGAEGVGAGVVIEVCEDVIGC